MLSCLLSALSLSLSLSISSFFVGMFIVDVLFFFLSLALGKPKPFRGLVSTSWPRAPTWMSTPCSATTPRSCSRTCFFQSTSFVFPVAVGLGLSLVCWAFLCLSLSLFFGGHCALLNARRHRIERGGGLLDSAPVHDYNHFWGGIGHEAVSRMVCPEPLVGRKRRWGCRPHCHAKKDAVLVANSRQFFFPVLFFLGSTFRIKFPGANFGFRWSVVVLSFSRNLQGLS